VPGDKAPVHDTSPSAASMTILKSTPSCYLDHASATPLLPEVVEVMAAAERDGFANPSSPHAAGRAARRLLETSRERLLAAIGGRTAGPDRDRFVFTSGASEATQMALAGLRTADRCAPSILCSPRDHPGTLAAARLLAAQGRAVRQLPLKASGRIASEALAEAGMIDPQAVLSVTLACSQTGIIEDVEGLRRAWPTLLIHADAVQAAGRMPLDPTALGVASMTITAHKLGGPLGIGGLFIRGGTVIEPLIAGTQELSLRGGTEPVALAVGFATAVELAVQGMAAEARRLADLRDRFERGLSDVALAAGCELVVIGRDLPRCPQISVVSLPGRERQAVVMAADLAGLCIASGTACASGSSEPSAALAAMGLPQAVLEGAIRISVGWPTSTAEIDQALEVLKTRVLARTA
jgi:cysteine desulfurase